MMSTNRFRSLCYLVKLFVLQLIFTSFGQAMSFTPDGLIAQMTIKGGFRRGPVIESGVNIYKNGNVESFEVYRESAIKLTKIAVLSKGSVEKILKVTSELDLVSLIPYDPAGFECVDAPITTFYGVNNRGEKVILEQNKNCKTYIRRDEVITDIPEVLRGLRKLN